MNTPPIFERFPWLADLWSGDAKEFLRIHFPYNITSAVWDPQQRVLLLILAIKIGLASNRLLERGPQLPGRLPSEHFLVRNRSGVCCHPIFVSVQEYEDRVDEWENDAPEDQGRFETDPDTKDRLVRSRVSPLPIIAQLMMDRSMLVRGSDGTVRIDHRYPEDFCHGDLLQIAVLASSDAEQERLPSWYRNSETYMWLETALHPHGYPYSLAYYPDEYGCLPATVTFGNPVAPPDEITGKQRLSRPDSHAAFMDHNNICHPSPDVLADLFANMRCVTVQEYCDLLNASSRETDSVLGELLTFLDEKDISSTSVDNSTRSCQPTSAEAAQRLVLYSIVDRSHDDTRYVFFIGAFEYLRHLLGGDASPRDKKWPVILQDAIRKGRFNLGGSRLLGSFNPVDVYYLVCNPLVPEDFSSTPAAVSELELAKSIAREYSKLPSPEAEREFREAQTPLELQSILTRVGQSNAQENETRASSRKKSIELETTGMQFELEGL
jgi:hypothetical protein